MSSGFPSPNSARCRRSSTGGVVPALAALLLTTMASGCKDAASSSLTRNTNTVKSTRASLGEVTRHYCGVIDPSQPSRFSVHLHNHTSQPLKVTQANVSCGCMSLLDVPESIPPKMAAELRLEWDAAHSSGLRQQRILVATDSPDPTHSLYQIVASASIRSVWSSPVSVDFGRVCLADAPCIDFVVSVLGYEEVQFEKVESDSPHFNAQLGRQSCQRIPEASLASDVQHDQQIRVCVAEDSAFGQISGTLRVSLIADGKQLTSTVPLLAEVTGLVRCIPPQAVWANAVGGQELHTTVRVKASADKIIDLSRIEFQANTSTITAQRIESSSEDVSFLVTMTIPPDSPQGQLRGYVSGTIGEQEVLRLPVLAIVQR
jgi:uncharacterized protein DUF1573